MESINPSTTEITAGLQTAWLLATLGSKPSIRSRLIKKDILNILIPKLCKELSVNKINQHNEYENNIRYVSNIMYGISILYQTKINYFITDLASIENRLKYSCHNTFNKVITSVFDNNGKKMTRKRGRFLDDDPGFSIHLGLLPPIDDDDLELKDVDEDECTKRRRIFIQEWDEEIFPILQEQNHLFQGSPVGFAFSSVMRDRDQDSELLNDMMDNLGNVSSQLQDIVVDDFQFNEEGEILDNHGQNMNEVEHPNNTPEEEEEKVINSGMESLMDITFEANNEVEQEILQQQDVRNEEASISNDLNFHTTETTTFVQHPQDKKLPRHKLVIDQQSKLSSESIVSSALNYESKMTIIMNQKNNIIHSLDEVYQATTEEIEGNVYLNHVNRITMPWANNSNNTTTEHSSFTRTLSVLQRTEDAITGEQPTEEGRDIVRSRGFVFNEEFPIDMIDGQPQENDLPEETQRIFDIEFDYGIELSPLIVVAYKSRSTTESSMGSNIEEGEVLDKKLKIFYRYLRDRSGDLGTLISGPYSISKFSQNLTTNTNVSFGDFYTTNFDQLVPRDSRIENDLPVNRRIAANSFSSILTLATKNLIAIEVENDDNDDAKFDHLFDLHKGENIKIIMPL